MKMKYTLGSLQEPLTCVFKDLKARERKIASQISFLSAFTGPNSQPSFSKYVNVLRFE